MYIFMDISIFALVIQSSVVTAPVTRENVKRQAGHAVENMTGYITRGILYYTLRNKFSSIFWQ